MNLSAITSQTQHRPWPMPQRPWVMSQSWLDLLFAHWPVEPEHLRPVIPPGLELETFEGKAWIGVVPFRMKNVSPRFVPPLPWLSAFPELNVRTYVTDGKKSGVWFFSLDAANPVAVRAARVGFHLPYYDANMSLQERDNWIYYRSQRTHSHAHPARLNGRYRPRGPIYYSQPGSLENWLSERYCLYASNGLGPDATLWRGEIQHAPWPLQPAQAEFSLNTMTLPIGLELKGEPLLHFVRRIDVVVWMLEKV